MKNFIKNLLGYLKKEEVINKDVPQEKTFIDNAPKIILPIDRNWEGLIKYSEENRLRIVISMNAPTECDIYTHKTLWLHGNDQYLFNYDSCEWKKLDKEEMFEYEPIQ